jgi:sugar/nucleoside kinase (ribokinase family)/ABC-type sugar transport system substrate-binding protein
MIPQESVSAVGEGTMLRAQLLGLGAAAMDHVLRCEDLPREDGFAFVHEERILPGGSCANVLVAATKLGTSAALMAKMGDDDYGKAFKADLDASGVSSRLLTFRKGGTSLHTFITVTRTGAKAVFVHMGDSLSLSAEEVHDGMLDGVGVFFTEMLPAPPALKLTRLSVARGVPVVFQAQVTPRFKELCGISTSQIEEMLSLSDLVIASAGVMVELGKEPDPVRAASSLQARLGPDKGVIATLGEGGAVWVTGEETLCIPPFDVDPVDTTGAGDAFAGGLLHALFTSGLGRRDALEFATACAAIKCTQTGPRFQANEWQVRSFLAKGWGRRGNGPHAPIPVGDPRARGADARSPRPRRIGLLLADRSNPFWEEMKEQYRILAPQLGLRVTEQWPSPGQSPSSQLRAFRDMLKRGFDLMVINPMTATNLVPGIFEAAGRGIPVLDVGAKTDAGALGGRLANYVPVKTVDFHRQGLMAGTYILARIEAAGGGKVAIVPGRDDSAQSVGRCRGAMDALGSKTAISVVRSRPADFDREKARRAAVEILAREPDIKAFFCANDTMALGVAHALEMAGRLGKVVVVGVDLIEEAREAIRLGRVTASVAFSPADVARLVLMRAVSRLEGGVAAAVGEVRSVLVDADNLDSYLAERNVDRRVPGGEPWEPPFSPILKKARSGVCGTSRPPRNRGPGWPGCTASSLQWS